MVDSDYIGHPGDLDETGTLKRLTIDEKAVIARDAIENFPHLSGALDSWLNGYGVDVPHSASTREKVNALVDHLESEVRNGENPEALDQFIYGYLYPANLESHDVHPDIVAERDPLDVWEGVYDD